MERTLVQLPCQEELQGGNAIGTSEKAAENSKPGHHDAPLSELQWMRNGTTEAPVFHPSVEEFRDPIAYIRLIRSKAEPFGLCKIVPPYPATTQCFEALRRDAGHTGNIGNLKLTTRQQLIGEKEWEDWSEDRFWGAPERSLKAFHQAADATATKVFGTCLLLPPRRVEEEFWKRMSKPTKANSSSPYVEYGDNVSGTGFLDAEGDPLGSSLWNLNKFHSSADARSPLKLLQTSIPGVTSPHVYHGALFSTSCWLVQDLYLLSLNFLHIGAPKTWYAVPAQHADDFEKAVQDKVYAKMCAKMREMGASEDEVRRKVLETLARKNTVVSPEHLLERDIPITRTDQAAGEFVVTFARTYHLGFSHGINLGEGINFALTEWYEYGTDAALRLTFLRKPPVPPPPAPPQPLEALPVEQMACVDMLTLAESLKANAEAEAGQDFRGWLLGPGASTIATTSVPLIVSFCRLIRELMHVAAIMPETAHEPMSLRHCLLTTGKDPSSASKGVLLLHEKWEVYQELAQMFGELCLQQGWGGADAEEWKSQGLTDRLNIPASKSAPCWEDLSAPYSWQLDDSSPLHSAWSSNEFLPRASDKDGTLLPVFEAVYPAAAADVPVVAAPSKVTAGAKRSSSKGGRGSKKGGKGGKETSVHAARAQTPEVADGANPSPHATTAKSTGQGTPEGNTPGTYPLAEGDAPRKRASRASKNAAMASWKANKMLDEDDDADDDSRSEDGTRQSRRSKKMRRDESMGALQTAKTDRPGLAKVYSNATSLVPQEYQTERLAGKDTSGGSPLPNESAAWPTGSAGMPLSDYPPHSQSGSHAALPLQGQSQQSMHQQVQQHQQQAVQAQQQQQQAQMPQQQMGQQGQAWSGGAVGAARPRSQSLSPISNYNAFHSEQDRWRRSVSEVNNQWVQKLQECAKTNADVQNLLRYYMSLPDVSHVYPVSADARSMGPMAPAATAASGGAPSSGMPGGNGAASVGALQNGSGALQGSGALSGSTLPMQQTGTAQRRTLQGQAMNAWPPNSARKESLHNGPISAQDLATSIRGRPASSDDSRQNGGKGRNVMGAPNMQAPGVNPGSAAAATVAATAGGNPPTPPGGPGVDGRARPMQGGHRSSATNLPHTVDGGAAGLAHEQAASHVSPSIPMQPGGAMSSLGLHAMDGQPQSPMLPLTPHSPADTPRSGLDDIINGTRNSDFHDFLSSLGDHDDADLGMEF